LRTLSHALQDAASEVKALLVRRPQALRLDSGSVRVSWADRPLHESVLRGFGGMMAPIMAVPAPGAGEGSNNTIVGHDGIGAWLPQVQHQGAMSFPAPQAGESQEYND
jgi:hypothetical protein